MLNRLELLLIQSVQVASHAVHHTRLAILALYYICPYVLHTTSLYPMFLIIATFKSNKVAGEVESWLKAVSPAAAPLAKLGERSGEVVVAPSFPHLSLSNSKILNLTSNIYLASQDVSPFPPGSYTGAVNAVQLRDLGVKYCLVGHSERRHYFHETHLDIANKIRELVGQEITPVLCVAKDDIAPQLAALDDQDKAKTIFVYEPPADIGGTKTAPLDDINTTTGLIRSLTTRPVLYGGSVNAGNLDGLLELGVDGVLVSTACLDSGSFIDLLNRYKGF